MDIGILTFHRACNIGANLQAYALKTVIEQLGYRACLLSRSSTITDARFYPLSCRHKGILLFLGCVWHLFIHALTIGSVDLRRLKHWRFAQRYFNERLTYGDSFVDCCDAVVCGSDQVWNPKLSSEIDFRRYIGLDVDVPCISYAASVGDGPIDNKHEAMLRRGARNYIAISVREKLAGDGLLDRSGRPAKVVLDPTLLLDSTIYRRVEIRRPMRRKKYIIMYVLRVTQFILACAQDAERETGLPVVILAMYQYGLWRCPKNVKIVFGPSDWLTWFRDAEAVMAASFHGTAFALIYKKPFVSIRNSVDIIESRPLSLLRLVGAENRLVNPTVPKEQWLKMLTTPISADVLARLEKCRAESLQWLKTSIDELSAEVLRREDCGVS